MNLSSPSIAMNTLQFALLQQKTFSGMLDAWSLLMGERCVWSCNHVAVNRSVKKDENKTSIRFFNTLFPSVIGLVSFINLNIAIFLKY